MDCVFLKNNTEYQVIVRILNYDPEITVPIVTLDEKCYTSVPYREIGQEDLTEANIKKMINLVNRLHMIDVYHNNLKMTDFVISMRDSNDIRLINFDKSFIAPFNDEEDYDLEDILDLQNVDMSDINSLEDAFNFELKRFTKLLYDLRI